MGPEIEQWISLHIRSPPSATQIQSTTPTLGYLTSAQKRRCYDFREENLNGTPNKAGRKVTLMELLWFGACQRP